jgi:hypothetical protein
MFARRRFRNQWKGEDFRPPWAGAAGSRRRSASRRPDKSSSESDRFEEWHRMAHAKEEVDGWADEPE